jgi:hypothetical protein
LSSTVTADWKVHFNQLDLDFARECFLGRRLTFRPYAGIRVLFIEEKYDIATVSSATLTGTPVVTNREAVTMKDHFKGVGLKAGFLTSFDFSCGIALYGDATWSSTFGQFKVKQNSTASVVGSGSPATLSVSKDDTHDDLLNNFDIAFGIRWRQLFDCDRNAFTLRLGWENHVFFDFNKFRSLATPEFDSIVDNSPGGDLSFYGIVFAAGIDF